MSSYKAEMLVDGGWSSNALRFETEAAASIYARDLFLRWTQPNDKRVVPSDDEPTLDSPTVAKYEDEAREFLTSNPEATS